MKTFFINTIISLLLTGSLYAQLKNGKELSYLIRNHLDYDQEGTDILYLLEGGVEAYYVTGDRKIVENTNSPKGIIVNISSGKDPTQIFYTNLQKDSLFYRELVIKDHIYVAEPIPDFKWLLVDAYKTIENKKLQKATTTFRGRNYTAWCDLDTPISIGPWKFNKLPGLAYEITDDDAVFHYEWHLRKVTVKKKMDLRRFDLSKHTFLSLKAFIAQRNKLSNDFTSITNARKPNIEGIEIIESRDIPINLRIRALEIKYEWEP